MNPTASTVLPSDAGSRAVAPGSLRGDAWTIGLVGLAHGSSHFSHLLLPALFPVFLKEFGLSFIELGMLSLVFFGISGIGQALSGFLVDRVGARPILYGSFICFIAASLVGFLAQGYWSLFVLAVLAGLGNAPFHPVDFSILNQRVSPQRLGYAYSVHGLSGNLGWALAPVFLMGFTAWSSWRTGYLASALMYAAILALLVARRRDLHTRVVRSAQAAGGSGIAFLRLPVIWWCFAFFLLSTMTLAVVQNFSVSIMQAMHGVSFESATTMLTAYMICGAVGILIGGLVATRVPLQSDRVVAWSMGAGAVLMALAGTGWLGGLGSMSVLAATGFAVGIGGPSRDLMIKKATPRGATGRVYGTVYSGLDLGQAVGPAIYGLFMDRGWYATTLIAGAVLLMASVYAAIGVGQRTDAAVT